jgi:hypothetical protein
MFPLKRSALDCCGVKYPDRPGDEAEEAFAGLVIRDVISFHARKRSAAWWREGWRGGTTSFNNSFTTKTRTIFTLKISSKKKPSKAPVQ